MSDEQLLQDVLHQYAHEARYDDKKESLAKIIESAADRIDHLESFQPHALRAKLRSAESRIAELERELAKLKSKQAK